MSGFQMRQCWFDVDTSSRGRGLYEVSDTIRRFVEGTGIQMGLCSVYVRHTSASLIIQENADPTARADLESWMDRLAPEGDPRYTHTVEGPDDMPAHLRSVVTNTSEQVPVTDGSLALGTWQGIYLWEHRRRGSSRSLCITVCGESA